MGKWSNTEETVIKTMAPIVMNTELDDDERMAALDTLVFAMDNRKRRRKQQDPAPPKGPDLEDYEATLI